MTPVRCATRLSQPARAGGDARSVGDDLLALLAAVPGWAEGGAAGRVVRDEVTLTQLGGAMSNHIFRVEVRRAPWMLCTTQPLTHLVARQSSRAGAPPLLLRLYGSGESGNAGGGPSSSSGGEGAAGAAPPQPPALFSREGEVATAEAVAALSLGPAVYVLFPNGRLEALLSGDPLTAPAMRSPRVAAAVAASLAHFHAS